ncbi:MAG: hypothetical protein DBX55_06580 [Verrucomicrobia bacterium]|nr:MAG: hypothetical protein DBX55_06580 [Verrucomicrobiota bacterium]
MAQFADSHRLMLARASDSGLNTEYAHAPTRPNNGNPARAMAFMDIDAANIVASKEGVERGFLFLRCFVLFPDIVGIMRNES